MKYKVTVGPDFFRAVNAFAVIGGQAAGLAGRTLLVCFSRTTSWAWGSALCCETYAEFETQGAPDEKHMLAIDAVKWARVINHAKAESMILEVSDHLAIMHFNGMKLAMELMPAEDQKIQKPKRDTTSPIFSAAMNSLRTNMKYMEHVLSAAPANGQYLWFKGGSMFSVAGDGHLARACSFPPSKDQPFGLTVSDAVRLSSYIDLYASEESVFSYVDAQTRNYLYVTTTGADFRSYLKIGVSFETHRATNPISGIRNLDTECEWKLEFAHLSNRLQLLGDVAEEDTLEIGKPHEGPQSAENPAVMLRIRSTQTNTLSQGLLNVSDLKGIAHLKPFRLSLKTFDRASRDSTGEGKTIQCRIHGSDRIRYLVVNDEEDNFQASIRAYRDEKEPAGK